MRADSTRRSGWRLLVPPAVLGLAAAPSTARGRRAGLWVLLGLIGLVVAAWGVLALLFPPARVRALVARQLSEVLAREVRFADAALGLWPPVRLSARRVEIAAAEGFSRGTVLRLGGVHLDLDPLALLARRVTARRLVLDRPELHLVLRADGTTNLDGLAKPRGRAGPAGRPMDLELREVRVLGGRALVDDLKAARRTLVQVESRVSLTVERGGARIATGGETELSGLAFGPLASVRRAELDAGLSKLKFRIQHRGVFDAESRRLALERLTLALGRAEVSLTGVVEEPGPAPAVRLRARGARVDLGELLAALAAADAGELQGIRGAGRLDFDLDARGRLGRGEIPTLVGTLAVTGGAFRYPGAAAGVEALALRGRLAPDSLVIVELSARVGEAADGRGPTIPLQGSVLVTRFADPWVAFTVRGDLDLAAIAPLVAPRDARLSGRAEVSLKGSGRVRAPGSVALDGEARLAETSVTHPSLPRTVEGVEGELRFSRERATVRGLRARAGQSSLTLDATVDRPLALLAPAGETPPARVEFQLRSPHLDLAELLPTTPGAPLLPNATGGGTVAIGRLRNRKLDVADVRARVELRPSVLAVPEYRLRGYGGTVAGNARFDLKEPARPGFEVRARVDSVQADALLSAWTPARGWLHGSLGTTLDLSGSGDSPDDLRRTLSAIGLALVTDGTLGPGPALEAVARATGLEAFRQVRFRDLRLPFRVERGRMITDPVTLRGSHGEWQLVGGIGFDGALDYAVSVTIPPEASARLGAQAAVALGALADERGNLLLDLRVTGSAKAPRVSWDKRAMADRLAGRVSQAVAEQRARLEEEARSALEARRLAAEDSARAALERARIAARDTLRGRARQLLRGFFEAPRDTTP